MVSLSCSGWQRAKYILQAILRCVESRIESKPVNAIGSAKGINSKSEISGCFRKQVGGILAWPTRQVTERRGLWKQRYREVRLPACKQQTISRLRELDKLPKVLSENLAVPGVDQTRYLSILREKEIASNLAFLLATSDENLKVMAVCIEEHCNGEGITIRNSIKRHSVIS